MELDIFNRQLKLLTLLTGNSSLTVYELSDRLGMSPRTIYRYIQTLRRSPLFCVEQSGEYYSLSKNSPFFKEVSDNISFTEDEAMLILGYLPDGRGAGTLLKNLRYKLERIYDYRVFETPVPDRRMALNKSRLYEAVKAQRTVLLKSYHSLHSESVSDRIVEPFKFLNSNDDVRCYEPLTHENKTFKISRIEEVVILDLKWSHTDKHETFYTDAFGFTDKHCRKVSLMLNNRAAKILQEEHPATVAHLVSINDNSYRIDIDVCSYIGIGRFVLGLHADIDILNPDDFKKYIAGEAALLTKKFSL